MKHTLSHSPKWLLIGVPVGLVIVTGIILIVLWQTGILFKPKSAEVTPTPVDPDPVPTTPVSWNGFTADLQSYTDFKETSATTVSQQFALSGDGIAQAEVVGNYNTGDFVLQKATRSTRSFTTPTAVDYGATDVWASAFSSDRVWHAIIIQDRVTLLYKMRFVKDGVTHSDKSVVVLNPAKSPLTATLFFDHNATIPTCYMGYRDNDAATYTLTKYHFTSDAWVQTSVNASDTVFQIYAWSRYGMLHSVGSTATQLKPSYRTSGTADWGYLGDQPAAFAGTLTNEGRLAIVLRRVDNTAIPTVYKWDGASTLTSLGDGAALDFPVTAEMPAMQFVIASAANSSYFAIMYLGWGLIKGNIRMYQVFSSITGEARVTTTSATLTKIKEWELANSDYLSGTLQLFWSNTKGLDIFCGLTRLEGATLVLSKFHINAQPT